MCEPKVSYPLPEWFKHSEESEASQGYLNFGFWNIHLPTMASMWSNLFYFLPIPAPNHKRFTNYQYTISSIHKVYFSKKNSKKWEFFLLSHFKRSICSSRCYFFRHIGGLVCVLLLHCTIHGCSPKNFLPRLIGCVIKCKHKDQNV